jgi:hypothetical protein
MHVDALRGRLRDGFGDEAGAQRRGAKCRAAGEQAAAAEASIL